MELTKYFNMTEPKLYTVISKDDGGKSRFKYTNSEQTAFSLEMKYDGTIYIDVRFKARTRLFNYLQKNNLWKKNNQK